MQVCICHPKLVQTGLDLLEGVLGHYAAGGRAHDNPNKDPLIGGFTLSEQDRKDLIEFLRSLNDEPLLHDPKFANPWPQPKGTQP